MGSAIDITELKQREEENLARQKMESVGMLASGIAHDFNNLLGSVLAQSELALDLLSAGELPKQELTRIGEISRRGSEIVRQLMIYAGRESEPAQQVELSQVVAEMLELLGVSISKHATLKLDLGAELPAVRGEGSQIRQIVMNLVTNASEAVPGDGEIRVSTRKESIGSGRTGATGDRLAEGDYVRLEVSDTGCGMDRETLSRMFDPFFTTKPSGRGLGLAVVQGIVCALDGGIEVTSEPGQGATFAVLLPCAKPRGAPTVDLPPPVETATPRETGVILIVEDEELLRKPLSTMMRKHGFLVIEAGDGNAALEAIRAEGAAVDVLLLDLTLPGAPSDVVFAEAKRLMPGVRVVATTAYTEGTAAAKLQRKPDYFIRKPYRVGVLLDLVHRAMASRDGS